MQEGSIIKQISLLISQSRRISLSRTKTIEFKYGCGSVCYDIHGYDICAIGNDFIGCGADGLAKYIEVQTQ